MSRNTFKMASGNRKRGGGSGRLSQYYTPPYYNNKVGAVDADGEVSKFRCDLSVCAPNPFKIGYSVTDYNGVPFVHYNGKATSLPVSEYMRCVALAKHVSAAIVRCYEHLRTCELNPGKVIVDSTYVIIGHDNEVIKEGNNDEHLEAMPMEKALSVAADSLKDFANKAAEVQQLDQQAIAAATSIANKGKRDFNAEERAWLLEQHTLLLQQELEKSSESREHELLRGSGGSGETSNTGSDPRSNALSGKS